MNQYKSLLWKEWLEIRVFLLIAIFVFIGLPVLGGFEARIQTGRFEIIASAWTYFLGGVLAIFVGVGTVVRDLNGRLEDFWRSRPVSISRWIIVKYFVGLAVVIFALVTPLMLELLNNQSKADLYAAPQLVLAWHPFLWAVLYSVGFLMACLVRRGAHAAMLSLAFMLLLYFLPEIIPPLRHFSVSWVMQESQFPRMDGNYKVVSGYHRIPWALGKVVFRPVQLEFAAGMLVMCALAVSLSLLVIRRDTRVESGRRTIYWSIGGALLILFTSASFQVASNLTLLQTIDLPNADQSAGRIVFAGDRGLFFSNVPHRIDANHFEWLNFVHHFKITPAGIELEPAISIRESFHWGEMLWRPGSPDIVYIPEYDHTSADPKDPYKQFDAPRLEVYTLGASVELVGNIALPQLSARDWGSPTLYATADRLYFLGGRHAVTFDLADPLKPRFINHQTFARNPLLDWYPDAHAADGEFMKFALPEIAELSPEQRLAARAARWGTFDGQTICLINETRLLVYQLDELTPSTARFRRAGRYDITPVQQFFNRYSPDVSASNGFLYATTKSNVGSGIRLSVFDIHDPQRPFPAAHFALPRSGQECYPCSLPDGRILLACRGNLYLLSAPKGR